MKKVDAKIQREWENLRAATVMPRDAETTEEAGNVLKNNGIIGKILKNTVLHLEAQISGKSLREMMDSKFAARAKSTRLLSKAIANADILFERARFDIVHPDTHKRKEVEQVHRLGALMADENDYVPVMITVIEYKKDGNRIYAIKAIDIGDTKKAPETGAGKSAGQLTAASDAGRQVPIADFTTKITQLLDFVKGNF